MTKKDNMPRKHVHMYMPEPVWRAARKKCLETGFNLGDATTVLLYYWIRGDITLHPPPPPFDGPVLIE